MSASVEQRLTASVLLSLCPPWSFWRKALTEPGAHWLARQADQQSLEIPISARIISACCYSWLKK